LRRALDRLTPLDWQVLRQARLKALLDAPHAFMSSFAVERRWREDEWRKLFNGAKWIIAREADEVIGLARSVAEPAHSQRYVESIWVAPTHRRRGVLRALLCTLAQIERQMGATDLLLWVLEDNCDALRAYKAVGFEATGERQYLPALGRFEDQLRLGVTLLLESEIRRTPLPRQPPHRQTQLVSRS
jgi:ribosomal protein S18 acetylase RimI-like enzyme